MDIARLRSETAEDHRAAEASLPLMTENLRLEEYIASLVGIYGIVSAWEEYAAAKAPAWLQGIVNARKRKQLLERDLAWFGAALPAAVRPGLPYITDEAGLLGAMYVMEGSTLGGRLIARHVTRVLGFTGGCGSTFFNGHGERTGAMWKEFCDVLRTEVADVDAPIVIQSASAMFQVFGSWLRQLQPAEQRHHEECVAT